MIEEWKEIKDYEGYYLVSNLGRVKSKNRVVTRGNNHITLSERIIKSFVNNRGYEMVSLHKDGCKTSFLVHRLVAIAFLPNPFNFPYINHKDENPLNNNLENLEWCSQEYNVNYGNSQSKLTLKKLEAKKGFHIAQYTLEGQFIREFNSASQIQRELGFNSTPILNCCRRGYYKYGKWQPVLQSYGFIWKLKR